MKRKEGDVVTIKSLEWYDKNKRKDGYIIHGIESFAPWMSVYCGKIAKIIKSEPDKYYIDLDRKEWIWHDWMFEI